MSKLIAEMISAGYAAVDDLRERISGVRYGSCSDGKNRILFTFYGEPYVGILRGRNADWVLTGGAQDRALALRTFLDGDAELVTETEGKQ